MKKTKHVNKDDEYNVSLTYKLSFLTYTQKNNINGTNYFDVYTHVFQYNVGDHYEEGSVSKCIINQEI